MKRWIIFSIIIFCVVTLTQSGTKKHKTDRLSKITYNFAERVKQGFNMRVWLSNQMCMGLQAWDGDAGVVPDGFGMEYPTGSGVEHLYGAGPRIGGIIDGGIRVTEGYNGSDARKEFQPEQRHPLRDKFWRTSVNAIGEPNFRGCDDDRDGKIDEDELDGNDNDGDWNPTTDDVGSDGLADPYEVSCDGKPYDLVANPDPAGDNFDPAKKDKCHPTPEGTLPFKKDPDVYTENNGIPDHGEPNVDEDYGAISDNDLYCSATDTFLRPIIADHNPMGIKVIQKSYAWDNPAIGAILPFDYWFINVGRRIIKDVYVGFFADMDLGPVNIGVYYQNDYSAYMESLRCAYIHNPQDRGSTPLGLVVLNTPRALDSLYFIWQWSDYSTRPEPGTNDSLIYTWINGTQFTEKIAPSQPETNLSDTRFLFSFGKFDEIKPGDTLKISVALVSGFTVSEGRGNLKENVEKAIKLFRRGYVTPTPMKSPRLDQQVVGNTIHLKWYPHQNWDGTEGGPYNVWDDSNKYVEQTFDSTHWRRANPPCSSVDTCSQGSAHKCVDGKLPGGRPFSGFRLYRSEDVGNDAQINSFTLLREYSIPATAALEDIERLDSTFVDSFLVRGKRYWYSVTAFGLPDITLLQVVDPITGQVRYDTLKSENVESAFSQNYIKIDVPFDVSRDKNGKVAVVPNPYRVDQDYTYENGGWEGQAVKWDEQKRRVKFIYLPAGEWVLRIFTLTGELVSTIQNTTTSGYINSGEPNPDYDRTYKEDRGEIEWNLVSENRRALASGVYVFTVESLNPNIGGTQIGKFVLIR